MLIYFLYIFQASVPIIRRNNCIYVTPGTCYSVWMTGMQGGMKHFHSTMHTRQSSIQNNKYEVSNKYSCFSWWWAHSCPKHVEKRNKHTKKNCAPSWLDDDDDDDEEEERRRTIRRKKKKKEEKIRKKKQKKEEEEQRRRGRETEKKKKRRRRRRRKKTEEEEEDDDFFECCCYAVWQCVKESCHTWVSSSSITNIKSDWN